MGNDNMDSLEDLLNVETETKQKKNKLALTIIISLAVIFGGTTAYLMMLKPTKTSSNVDVSSVGEKASKIEHSEVVTDSEEYQKATMEKDIRRAREMAESGGSVIPQMLASEEKEIPKKPELPKNIENIPLKKEVKPIEAPQEQKMIPQTVVYNPPMEGRGGGISRWLNIAEYQPGTVQISNLKNRKDREHTGVRAIEEIIEGPVKKFSVIPGEMFYGVVEIGIISTQPDTPAIVELVSGKYSGAKLIGGWRAGEDALRLQFNKIVFKDTESGEMVTESITAFAVNPETYFPGVLTDINRHTIERYVKLMASSFAEGFADARSASGTTYTYGNDNNPGQFIRDYSVKDQLVIGAGKVAERLSDKWAKDFDKPPTITLNPGHPIGIAIL